MRMDRFVFQARTNKCFVRTGENRNPRGGRKYMKDSLLEISQDLMRLRPPCPLNLECQDTPDKGTRAGAEGAALDVT